MNYSAIANSAMRHPTLGAMLWPSQGAMRAALLAVGGVCLLTLSAKIQIPPIAFFPVPFTMQTFVVLVLGITLGARLAAATVCLYLITGAFGLPVFAGGGGLVYFTGPTAGFLLAFPLAAATLGHLAERGFARTFISTIGVMLLGTAIIFGAGIAWLAVLFGMEKAIALGLLPFIYSEAVKILLAATAVPGAWKIVHRRK